MSEEAAPASGMASKGGKARAASMTPGERKESARKAAEARWEKSGKRAVVPTAVCGSPDRPLRIADIEIPCYVLGDGRRVVVQGGMLKALDMSKGTGGKGKVIDSRNSSAGKHLARSSPTSCWR